jgi:hypothetical protein
MCCGDASAVLSHRIVHHQPERDAVSCWDGELHLFDVLPTTAFHQRSSLYTLHLTAKPQNLDLLLLHSPQNAPSVTSSYNFVNCSCRVQQYLFSSTTFHQEPQHYNGIQTFSVQLLYGGDSSESLTACDDTSHFSHPTNLPSCMQSSLHLARPKIPSAPKKGPKISCTASRSRTNIFQTFPVGNIYKKILKYNRDSLHNIYYELSYYS